MFLDNSCIHLYTFIEGFAVYIYIYIYAEEDGPPIA